nr:MAG TPA: hypothetical protein [Caudoviricetes sp.]
MTRIQLRADRSFTPGIMTSGGRTRRSHHNRTLRNRRAFFIARNTLKALNCARNKPTGYKRR